MHYVVLIKQFNLHPLKLAVAFYASPKSKDLRHLLVVTLFGKGNKNLRHMHDLMNLWQSLTLPLIYCGNLQNKRLKTHVYCIFILIIEFVNKLSKNIKLAINSWHIVWFIAKEALNSSHTCKWIMIIKIMLIILSIF